MKGRGRRRRAVVSRKLGRTPGRKRKIIILMIVVDHHGSDQNHHQHHHGDHLNIKQALPGSPGNDAQLAGVDQQRVALRLAPDRHQC